MVALVLHPQLQAHLLVVRVVEAVAPLIQLKEPLVLLHLVVALAAKQVLVLRALQTRVVAVEVALELLVVMVEQAVLALSLSVCLTT